MADLNPLIRLRRHSVDEKQKALSELYRQVEAFEARKTHLLDQLQRERDILNDAQQVEMIAYFGRFSEAVAKDVERLNAQISRLEGRIRIAQDDIRNAFADLKRVEIVQRSRNDREKAAADRKETNELDDIGIDGFRRKAQENEE